ncbi:MAG: hypothetical protein ACREQ4_15455 [Candidatus Binataceae bacterium]
MAALSKGIEPATRAFLESINAQHGPQIYEIPVEEGRAALTRLQAVAVTKPPVDTEDRIIADGPKDEVRIRMTQDRLFEALLNATEESLGTPDLKSIARAVADIERTRLLAERRAEAAERKLSRAARIVDGLALDAAADAISNAANGNGAAETSTAVSGSTLAELRHALLDDGAADAPD